MLSEGTDSQDFNLPLPDTQEWLHVTLTSIGDAVITTDPAGRVTYLNPTAEKLTGWDFADAYGLPMGQVFKIINEQTQAPAENPIQKVIESGLVVGLANHTALISRSGQVIPIEDSAAPIKDGTGEVLGVVMVFHDVSEKRRSEDRLQQLSRLIELSYEPIFTWDFDGSILTWNQGCEKLYGYTAEEAIGQISHELLKTRHPIPLEEFNVQLLSSSSWTGELRHQTKQGKLVIVESRHQLIEYGDRRLVLETIRDVTERKLREELASAIHQIDILVNSSLKVDDILNQAISAAAGALGCETAALSLRDEQGWVVSYVHGFPESIIGAQMDDDQERHGVLAMQTKLPVVVTDTASDERVNREHLQRWGIRSVLVVPVVFHDTPIGAVFFNYYRPMVEFHDAHVEFASQLAATISLALENARLVSGLETEILQRKQAENELIANKLQLEAILESIQDGFIQLNQDWQFTYVNQRAASNIGWQKQDLLGKNIWETFPELLGTKHERYYRQVMQIRQPSNFEMKGILTPQCYNIRVYPAEGGISVFWLDISEKVQSEEQARLKAIQIELHHRLLEQREQERQQIARDLHDGPVQEILGAIYALDNMVYEFAEQPEQAQGLKEIQQNLKRQIAELRAYAGELRPPALFEFGLNAAIRSYIDEFQEKHGEIKVEFQSNFHGANLTQPVQLALYRILQEGFYNVLRHAQATAVWVHIEVEPQVVVMRVRDNGKGFTPPSDWIELARQGHLGVVGMRERAEAVGGKLSITSTPGSGTLVEVEVPAGL